jgi:hypothetical protein
MTTAWPVKDPAFPLPLAVNMASYELSVLTSTESVREQGAEQNIWTEER